MGSLTTCLKKAGDKLDSSDRVFLHERAAALRKEGRSADEAAQQAVNERLAEMRRLIAEATGTEVETADDSADTEGRNPNDDPAPATAAPALDQPMAEGREPGTEPVRGARQPRQRARRADDRSVRGQGGLFEGVDDGPGNVGNGRGDADLPDRSTGAVERDGGRVSAPDFRAGPGALTREGSWFDTASRNVDLIELALKIDAEGRPATADEQAKLAKYVGFGAGEIRNNLFPVPGAYAKSQEPTRLIWPSLTRDARWKGLAERLDALPREWQKSVLQSTQYAHYTSEGIIRSIWSAFQRMGFTGGKMVEPGSGIGSFAMLMPDAVRRKSQYTGIEFDGPTALIARLLSPQQNMLHDDFIKRRLPKDYFDVAIGNPPFSQTKILGDPDYEKHGFMLHDFFFAKSIDRVRPGGLLVFVTSKGTMDKQSDKARKYLADRADLLGAIRLPQTAFEDNAGTKVVTDIIFLRKREPGQAPAGPAWGAVKGIQTKDGPSAVNEYFAANPEMVLGEQRLSGNRDDKGRYISGLRGVDEYTVVSYDDAPADLDAKVAAAVEKLPANVFSAISGSTETLRRETAKMDFDPKVRREGVVYLSNDGTLMRVEHGVGRGLADGVKLSERDTAWFKGYVGLRDMVQEARGAQVSDGDWQAALKRLNKAYDDFRKEHGPINDFRVQVRKSTDEEGREIETQSRIYKNRRLFREDYDASIVTQLETINEAGDVVKAAFLLGRTIGRPVVREVKTIGDALAVSLDETGRLDLADVARRIGVSREDAIDALGSQVYQTPQGQWQLADEYLAGDVVAKLDEAMDAAKLDRAMQRNVLALKAVQPDRLGPSQISVKLGASWVPVEFVNEFAREIEAGRVSFDPKTESWQVEGGNLRSERKAGATYGTADRSPSELLEAALNSRAVTIKKRTEDKKEVTDAEATTAATEAVRKIKEKFKGWIWTDADRASELVELYNRRFNNIAPRRFDGSHLTLPGVSLRFKLHPHQLRAIWRQIQTGNTYLAHAVGAGKTIEMIAGGMEQKRLGLINKPMYVVPNHMLEQFANEFMELYPLANIMVADDENFSADRRKAFVAAATLNAPDAIIITHSAFERIGVKEESVAPIRDEILADLEMELNDVEKGDRVRRSQLEQQVEAVTQRFDSIVGAGKKDSTLKFEDIGADHVFVDEAHTYRKLDFSTNQKIKGIDPNGSRRALDMYVKTRWLERQKPGRAMTFASGTPVTNTMGELYTIMRFFAPDELNRAGIASFDGWSRQFGESVAALEANAAGKYETVERFAKFDNVPELMSRVRQFMDVLTSEHLGALVKRPDLEGGKPNMVTVDPTPALKAYMKAELVPRLEASRKWKPSKDEPFNPDPVIAITSDGRFAALDPRFFGAKVDDSTPTKMTAMADAIAAEYAATAGNAYTDKAGKAEGVKGSTQIVFYNLGFGQQSQKNRGFNARGALTNRLVDKGVKRDHILWFDDADTDAKKEAAFKAMRSGQARVLIGSAKKMGTGVNVQKRLSMLHYFDPPWYPSDVEQPHGRIIRQGNQNERVRINWYATKGTYDSTMWQMVGRKQRFIDQAFSGDKSLRSMDDLSEASVFEQAAAVASGDPRALQLAGLRQDVERFERLQAAHANEQINVRTAIRDAQWQVEIGQKRAKTYGDAFKAIGERYFAFTAGKVGRQTFDKQGEFGQALKDAFNRKAADHVLNPSPDPVDLATVGDLPLRMHPDFDHKGNPTGTFELVVYVGDHQIEVVTAAAMGADVDAVGLTRRVVNSINSVEGNLRQAKEMVARNETDLIRLRKKQGAPFEYQQEMAGKYGDLKRLEEELRTEGAADAAQPVAPVINEDGSLGPKASRAVPFVAVDVIDGMPTYANEQAGVVLVLPHTAVRLEVIEGPGDQVLNYAIMPMEGFGALGHVVLLVRDGTPVSVIDLQVYGKRAGVGSKVIETLLAANPGADLNISNIVPAARGFWSKMGVPAQYLEDGAHYDGTLNWQTYSEARDGRGTSADPQGGRGPGEEPDAGPARADRSAAGESAQGLTPAEAAAIMALPEATRNRLTGQRPTIESLQAEVDKLTDWPRVSVANSVDDLPPAQRKNLSAVVPGGGVRGVYFPDTDHIWLFAEHLHSAAEAKFVLLHEAFHRGLAKTIGGDSQRLLRQMYHTNGKLQKLAKQQMKAHKIGLDEAIEEALADLAGKGEARDLKGWAKLVDMIRGWLSDVGRVLGLDIKWTDDMVADFVAGAARAGLDGGAHVNAATDARLSRTDAAADGPQTAQGLVGESGGVFDFGRMGRTKQDRLRTVIDGSRPFWLGALTRDQIADIYGKDIPPVKAYDTLTRAMENQRSKIAQDADTIYSAWAKLDSEVNDRLGRVMLDATVHSVHPDGEFNAIKSNDAETEAERKKVHKRIRREFAELPKDAQAMYATVRDFHSGMLEQLKGSLEKRIERQVQDGKARAATLTSIREMFDKYKEHGPYFPLSRFGDYLVIGTRPDGERVVASYETAGEQQTAARALRKDGFTVKTKTAKEYSRAIDGSAGKFAGDVLTMLNDLDMAEASIGGKAADLKTKLMDDVNQLFIRALPDLSYRKHFAHRKNTPGFSSDVMRGFASSAFHAASHIARLNHADQMGFALEDAYKAIDQVDDGDFNTQTQVLNELAQRHDAAMNPNTHPIAAMLNQVGFVMYLGASPAAGLVNLLQTPMVTLPYLGAHFGFGKAAGAMAKATKDIMGAKANRQSGWDATQSDKLTQVERDTMRKLQDEGVIDLTQAHDLSAATGLDTGNVARSKAAFAMSRAMKIVGWTFHVPEVMNRQVTALTAYRLEIEKSGDHAKAEEAAREAIKRTHFDYSSSNRARFMQGNVARVLLQFKQYSQNMTYLLGRAAYQAMKGESPEVRAIARRQLVATLASTFVMAGALGLPGLGALAGAIGMMISGWDDDDKPWDWKVEFRNLMADTFGKEVGEVLSHGVPRALMPWDLSNRVGMGDMWFRSSDREGQNPREAFADDMKNILGPTAGTLLGLYTASDHMARGNWGKAAEAIVPKAIRDPLQASRMATEGVTSYNGEHLKDLTAAEAVGKLLGFAPSSVSEMYESRNAIKNAETAIMDKRKLLISRAARARMDGDKDGAAEAMAEIQAFNKRNPQEAIKGEAVIQSIQQRRRHERQTVDGTYLPPKRDHLREVGRFAGSE